MAADKIGQLGYPPVSGAVYPSALTGVNAVTVNTDDITCPPGTAGVLVTVDITGVANTPSVVFTVQNKDRISGKYVDVLSSAAKTGAGTFTLSVHPALTAVANVASSALLSDIFRLKAVGGASAGATMTFSAAAVLVP